MYKIVVDRTHALIRLDMEGLLSPAEGNELVRDLIGRIAAARLASYALIIDVSRCPVQGQDMVATMGEHLTKMKHARALAIVTGTTLVRLQVRRIFNQPFTRFASSYDDALAWVLTGREPG